MSSLSTILSLPCLVNKFKYLSHIQYDPHYTLYTLGQYSGYDWKEFLYRRYNESFVFPLYNTNYLSIDLVNINGIKKYDLQPDKHHYIKLLDGSLKYCPNGQILGVHCISFFESKKEKTEKIWLENGFSEDSSVIIVSKKIL